MQPVELLGHDRAREAAADDPDRHVHDRPRQAQAEAVAEAQKALPKPLAVLNGALEGRDYLLGSTFTVADLNLASIMSWAKPIKVDFSQVPNVSAWLDRCLSRPSYKAARGAK